MAAIRSENDRSIRVFVSSTFRDMQKEREILIKRVFPELRKLCAERGVMLTEVDLRWGITEQQSQQGEVLPICLAEIERCRPYFIGLLGERYGWVPGEIPWELVEQQPWLGEHREKSVTELEILHGVLGELARPAMANRACFYFRDPAYVGSLAAEEQAEHCEGPTAEECQRFGPEEAQRRAEDRRLKLAALKDRIRDSGLAVREDYANPEQLGELVLRDLRTAINQEFPLESQPDALAREAAQHEAFARSRTGVYIGRDQDLDRLDAHVAGTDDPLVILGESGLGKSALVANWGQRYRAAHPDDLVILHFIGATADSTDWMSMLRRILAEFNRRWKLDLEIPEEPDKLRAAFAKGLHRAAQSRTVLVIDALNQLEDRDGALDVVWLPPVIPPNVRLIVSTLPGRAQEALERRGWPTLTVQPLSTDERAELIAKYLGQYTKRLSEQRAARIANCPQAANPLFLRALLEELRVFGEHERLDQRIDHYLDAATIDKLYERILQRFEEDYDPDDGGLVRDAMSLVWAARRGLSEAELLNLLGRNGEPLPRAYWSPLYLAAEPSLVNRSGLIGFFHDYFRQAVQDRYLPDAEAQSAAHLRVADYFQGRPTDGRRIEELPWQLCEAGAWQRLYDLLSDRVFYAAVCTADRFYARRYWSKIEMNSPLRLIEAYRPLIADPASRSCLALTVGEDLLDVGHSQEAFELNRRLGNHYLAVGDKLNLPTCLCNEAEILRLRGEYDVAMPLLDQAEQLNRQAGDLHGLQGTLMVKALVSYDRGDLDGAMSLLEQHHDWGKATGSKDALQRALSLEALIYSSRGVQDEALRLLKQQESICRELGDDDAVAGSLVNQAVILMDRHDVDGALRLYDEVEQRACATANRRLLAITLGNRALALRARQEHDAALQMLLRQEELCHELGDRTFLCTCLFNQALVWQDRGDVDNSLRLFRRQQGICSELGKLDDLLECIRHQIAICKSLGDLDETIRLRKVEADIFREQGDRYGLMRSLGQQAQITKGHGDRAEQMRLYQQIEQISRELGDKDWLFRSLGNQAIILQARGDLDGAIRLHEEEEQICRELGNFEALCNSLSNQARSLVDAGQPKKALSIIEEAHEIAAEHGLSAIAEGIQPLHEFIQRRCGSNSHAQSSGGFGGSLPHPDSDPNRAMRLNLEYQSVLAEWRKLPAWKRWWAKRPERPQGI